MQSKFGPEGRAPDKATVEVSSIVSVCGYSGCPNQEQLLRKELMKDMAGLTLSAVKPDASPAGVSLKSCSKCKAIK